MSTDYQQARAALGARLRELRVAHPGGPLTGSELAAHLGWPQSKISKLENGRQTATPEDLRLWAAATGHPDAYDELHARLQGFESHVRSWRRQLASGHRPVQDTWNELVAGASTIHDWEPTMVSGMLQTADYARHVFVRYAELQNSVRDTEEAVRSRMKRQEWLYRPGKKLDVLMWEAALRTLICPPSVLAAQLDRLAGVIGMDTVTLGIVPLHATVRVPPANGFWSFDGRLVITEDWHAELWLDDADTIATYQRVWQGLSESAVFGAEAQHVIAQVRRSLDVR
ncbi:helix-turn-helix domain-containing protein [Streptomyces sp. NBC_01800]|uniref:helix-turn-helix domain-containing protein n=1 Tax=Streptomyces sp. NBC_01800 TaxID=2975945 RepID=UPI002DD94596|nr:helix-turn-helix transcriptional regulator [Streptomyces sp. NBC_01800]WSA68400.1 helix-turn-helix transcriptional regulator [Streptomyces sp. NBC_01800]